jgi:hypothetical protein
MASGSITWRDVIRAIWHRKDLQRQRLIFLLVASR